RAQGRPGALAHADNGRGGRFDESDGKAARHPALVLGGDQGRRQPARGAPAYDNDFLNGSHQVMGEERSGDVNRSTPPLRERTYYLNLLSHAHRSAERPAAEEAEPAA